MLVCGAIFGTIITLLGPIHVLYTTYYFTLIHCLFIDIKHVKIIRSQTKRAISKFEN